MIIGYGEVTITKSRETKSREDSKVEGVKNQVLLLRMYCSPPETEDFFLKKRFRFMKETSPETKYSWSKDDNSEITSG